MFELPLRAPWAPILLAVMTVPLAACTEAPPTRAAAPQKTAVPASAPSPTTTTDSSEGAHPTKAELVAWIMSELEPAPARSEDIPSVLLHEELGLTSLAGDPAPLAAEGRVVVMALWATWCTPCVAEMRGLEQLSETLSPESANVVLVSLDESPDTVRRFLEEHPTPLSVFLPDSDQGLGTLNPPGLPVTYLFDTSGRLVYKHTGAADWGAEASVAMVRGWIEGGSNPEADKSQNSGS